MRILFAGNPAVALPSLAAISEMECGGENVRLAGALTYPDAPRGRKGIPVPTEVATALEALSLSRLGKGFPPVPVLKCEKLDNDCREAVRSLECDLLVCFAYGRLFGPRFLSLFPLGGINIHPSLLPRFRGPSPLSAAILAGDTETGVSIQTIDREMDAGFILAREKIPLSGRETALSLGEIAARTAAEMLKPLLRQFLAGTVTKTPQTGEPVYCSLIEKERGRIDWNAGAARIDAQVRAYTPWPLSFTRWNGEELYILEGVPLGRGTEAAPPGFVIGVDKVRGILIQTGDGVYAVSRVRRRAKKDMDFKAFLNGARDFAGSVLG